jgi:putative transcriptional regulator
MAQLEAGKLLIATPILHDPNFRRAVILLCTHDAEGSFGLVLNRPLEAAVADLLPDWRAAVAAPSVLFAGGPVERTHAFALGRSRRAADEPWWTAVTPEVGLVSLDDGARNLASVEAVRIFAGYAGWGADQLEAEVAEEAWFVVAAETRDVFAETPQRLWHEALRRQPDKLALFGNFPPDPRLN